MNLYPQPKQVSRFLAILGFILVWAGVAAAQPVDLQHPAGEIRIVELQGKVEVFTPATSAWVAAQTEQVLPPATRLRTGPDSRVALRWSDQSVVRFNALTELEILPPSSAGADQGLHLVRGILSFFHRDKPGRIRIITRGAIAGVEGTEFALAVDDTDRTVLSVAEGRVQLGNNQGSLLVTNGQQAVVELGQAPKRTAGFIVNDVLQWCFYYPAVLAPADLPLTAEEQKTLGDSLAAYRVGDLLVALEKYPVSSTPDSEAVRVYHAALLLSVGQVEKTETILATLPVANSADRIPRLATALRQLIAAVKHQPKPATVPPELATEFLAASYHEQAFAPHGGSLEQALVLARQAQTLAPDFGFCGARVAELEFSFGNTCEATEALTQSLAVSPRNAQALALKGFLLAAQNHPRPALEWFNRALAVDNALGNAWLGRGLCRLRTGDAGGREDLLVAAALEPQRAGLRSYLGKAYANAGDFTHAEKELTLARQLDPGDPTPWFYSALLNQERNHLNDAVRDLEKSQALNDNRGVYRSQLLLDQDRAVRGANLAALYRDVGMTDLSVREAGRAVNSDYASSSAHLFLANSYIALQDPNHINLRYDTPAENEYLLANLLAPVGAGILSPTISQQEYSRLFERDGFGVVSSTEYLSRGAWRQAGAQFGTFGNFSYNFEATYNSDPGQRANNDLEEHQLSLTLKQQLTPQDSVYLQVQQFENEMGDLSQRYDPNQTNLRYRVHETQSPLVGLGYHHEWEPGVHTLVYATRLHTEVTAFDPSTPIAVAFYPTIAPVSHPDLTNLTGVDGLTIQEQMGARLTIYSGELQQIWERPAHTTIVGLRAQSGDIGVTNYLANPSRIASAFPGPGETNLQQNVNNPFRRFSLYGYHQWQVLEPLRLIGGLAYDHLTFPENFRSTPVSDHTHTASEFSPKAGLIWTPTMDTAVRFAFARSLAGASMEQSYQLEPSQLAGFIQSYRGLIPESVAGANAGARLETFNLSLEQRFRTRTYLTISGELLNSTVDRITGIFNYFPNELEFPSPAGTHERLDYQERSFQLTLNQLVGQSWAFGARYRLSQAEYRNDFLEFPDSLAPIYDGFTPRQRTKGLLQQVNLTGIYNDPRGFFLKGEAAWFDQTNTGYTPAEPGDDFWQFNLFAGYRFPRRKAELTVGLLNLTGQDYRLSPLNIHDELARTRTLVVRMQFSF